MEQIIEIETGKPAIEQTVPGPGRRAKRMAIIYDREKIPVGQRFRTTDGATYKHCKSGEFVRTDKFHGSKKERLQARRETKARQVARSG